MRSISILLLALIFVASPVLQAKPGEVQITGIVLSFTKETVLLKQNDGQKVDLPRKHFPKTIRIGEAQTVTLEPDEFAALMMKKNKKKN